MGEICESGFIEKIGHFLWDFESLFLAIYGLILKKENSFPV